MIHCYGFCFNNEILLPYFLRHYETFCDKITIVDFHSTDASNDIVRNHPFAELRFVGTPGVYDERDVTGTANEIYKEARGEARWVIVVDVDEIIYHPNILELLKGYEHGGVTFPSTQAYQMVHHQLPKTSGQIYREIRTGFADDFYSRRAVFHPDIDIHYWPGCDHGCDPVGPVVHSANTALKLLHYNFFGPDRWVQKYQERARRMSQVSREKDWGTIYLMNLKEGSLCVPLVEDEAVLRAGYKILLRNRKLEQVVP